MKESESVFESQGGALEQPPTAPPAAPPNVPMGTGGLIVQAVTSRGGYPLENATIRVYTEEGPERFQRREVTTNRDGNTVTLQFPAPVLTDEQLYECKIRPYSVYTVEVSFPDFYTNIHKDVQIWPNTSSILTSNLMPLPANIGEAAKTKIYVVPPITCFQKAGGGGNA